MTHQCYKVPLCVHSHSQGKNHYVKLQINSLVSTTSARMQEVIKLMLALGQNGSNEKKKSKENWHDDNKFYIGDKNNQAPLSFFKFRITAYYDFTD